MARPRRSVEEVASVKVEICAAARGIYMKKGFGALTMRSVAAELSWSPTALYRYYRDRDALLADVRTGLFYEMGRALQAAADAAKSDGEAPLAIARGVFAFAQDRLEDYKLMFAMRQPNPSAYPELRQARAGAFNVVVAGVARATEAGLLDDDPRDLGHRVWLACQGLITLHAANQLTEGRSFDQLVPQVERMLFPTLA